MRDKNTKKSWSAAFLAAAAIIVTLLQGGTEAAPIVAGGGAIDRIAVVSETVPDMYTPGGANPAPNTFVDLPGAAVTLDVPPGTSRLFIVTYSAESACYGGAAGAANFCQVRVMIGGVEGNPAAGTDFAFDSTNIGGETFASWESHSAQRWRRIFNQGSTPLAVPIVVQRTTTSTATTIRLDDWQLTVLRSL